MIKETRQIGAFEKIHFRDFGTLILSQGETPSLTIEADEDLLPELITEVRGDTLVMGVDEDWISRIGKVISSVFNSEEHNVIYHLTFTDLSQIKVSGKCKLQCASMAVDDLSLKVSGLGHFTINHLDTRSLEVNISGRGDFTLSGRVEHQKLRISGSADYLASNLESESARIIVSGQGNATVRVQDNMDITISGLGQINYYGHPKIRQVITGFGKSTRLKDT